MGDDAGESAHNGGADGPLLSMDTRRDQSDAADLQCARAGVMQRAHAMNVNCWISTLACIQFNLRSLSNGKIAIRSS